jgi:hypothetical protein
VSVPLAFLAHQAVVLPLRIAGRRRVSGTALVLGSIAPDAEYVIRTYPTATLGHSWAGQIAFCLPLTIVLYVVVTRLVAPAVAANLRGGDENDGGLRSVVLLGANGRPVSWVVVGLSALMGSGSHVLLDRAESAVVRGLGSPLFESPPALVAEVGISLVLAMIAVPMLSRIARREGRPRPAAPRWDGFWPAVVSIASIGGVAGAFLRRPGFHLDEVATWVHIALAAVAAGFAGLVVASWWWRARARGSPSPVDSDSP